MSLLNEIECAHCAGRFFHDGSIAGRTITCPNCQEKIAIAPDARMHHDAPREIQDETLRLNFRIAGRHPVQAEGFVQGYPLYFRAKWDFWEFTVSLQMTQDPACMDPPSLENGFFLDNDIRGFYLGEDFLEASLMGYDKAESLIRRCAQTFFEAMENNSNVGQ